MEKINIKELLAKPDLLNTICDNVASGGSLIDLCETWGVRYCDVMRWLNQDDERKSSYYQAVNDRGEWFIQRVLKEIKAMAFVDFSEAFDDNGKLKSADEIPEKIMRCLSGIDIVELPEGAGTVKKLKFESKLKALELLGKNHFMFVERKVVLSGNNDDKKFRDEFFGLGKTGEQKTGEPIL